MLTIVSSVLSLNPLWCFHADSQRSLALYDLTVLQMKEHVLKVQPAGFRGKSKLRKSDMVSALLRYLQPEQQGRRCRFLAINDIMQQSVGNIIMKAHYHGCLAMSLQCVHPSVRPSVVGSTKSEFARALLALCLS
ncbi:hypothetical protein BJ138DRAFT_687869 [Hygrophoropsis aurantiaca]|uniref:Uncharacterized protein n=1 Tax=Hygrophoropsis aurantiaca TaxID=72124 RepID=A0ACB8ASX0_9AGAM|nr:hypothetical protein BJ138DRAFT_687869 [Hygrophoropsis aurantiaca]